MVLDDSTGNTWIMKGFQLGLKPERTYEQFMAAGMAAFKKLPPGWKVRVVTLKEDNHEVPQDGVATILAEQFQTVRYVAPLSLDIMISRSQPFSRRRHIAAVSHHLIVAPTSSNEAAT